MIALLWIEVILTGSAVVILMHQFMRGIEETKTYAKKNIETPPAQYGLSWWEMHRAVRRVFREDKRRPYRCRWQ